MADFSLRAQRELDGVHPALVAVVERAWELKENDYEVIDGIRTKAEQRNYVRRGVSKTMRSYHLRQADGYGHAVDIVPMVNGVPKWPNQYEAWKDIERAMKQAGRELNVPLTWGGDWRNRWDKPHWQIPREFRWTKKTIPDREPDIPKNVDTTDNFKASLKYVLQHEGGYSDHSRDPGGATNRGITHHTLARWRKRSVTKQDVKNLTMSETEQIYEAFYWDALRCDDIPLGIDYAVFDFGVNSGIGRSAKFLQRIVKTEQDGRVGKNTIRALNAYVEKNGKDAFIKRLARERLAYLKKIKDENGKSLWPVFGRGWERRVEEMERVALLMAKREKLGEHDRDVTEPTKPKSLLGLILQAILAIFKRK